MAEWRPVVPAPAAVSVALVGSVPGVGTVQGAGGDATSVAVAVAGTAGAAVDGYGLRARAPVFEAVPSAVASTVPAAVAAVDLGSNVLDWGARCVSAAVEPPHGGGAAV